MAKDTDKELVRRVQKGDRRAFDLLFSRYQHTHFTSSSPASDYDVDEFRVGVRVRR